MDPGLLRSLATLSDLARLRVLRLVQREELSVGELARVLQLPQSTVSRHLKQLHESGWVARRHEGTASLYRMDPAELSAGAGRLWEVVAGQLDPSPTLAEDDHRLAGVLAERRGDGRSYFGRLGSEWDQVRHELFGDQFMADALLSLLDPAWRIADLGCGTGAAIELLAPAVQAVYAVDREPAMLDAARQRLAGFDNVTYLPDELTGVSLSDGAVDAVIMSLVMVYVPQPDLAVAEAGRLLRQGGQALIIDLAPHDHEEYRHTMGHVHLGFDEQAVRDWAAAAKLDAPRYRRLRADTAARGPGLFVAVLRKS